MLRSRWIADERSPSLRTFATIRSWSPAKAGVQEREALFSFGPEFTTLLRSVLRPGLRRGTVMKQLNVWPMLILLVVVVLLVIWLKP